MKNLIILFMLSAFAFGAGAENDPYTKAMQETLANLKKAEKPDEFLELANKFERIAEVEKEEWLPSYYASFATTIAATMVSEPNVMDKTLDRAQAHLDNAKANQNDESEVLALQGFIYMIRIGVDPASRGQQYSGLSAASLQKAKALNPTNPRVLYLLAQLNFGTAQFFGSDSREACDLNDQALAQFNQSSSAAENVSLAPDWGKNMAEAFKKQCSN